MGLTPRIVCIGLQIYSPILTTLPLECVLHSVGEESWKPPQGKLSFPYLLVSLYYPNESSHVCASHLAGTESRRKNEEGAEIGSWIR